MSATNNNISSLSSFDSSTFLVLLNSSNPDTVVTILNDTFRFRNEPMPNTKLTQTSQLLNNISIEQTSKLYDNLCILIHNCLYNNLTTKESIVALFPADFHNNLKLLLTKLILNNISEWRENILNNTISPTKLIESNYTIDLKSSSSSLQSISGNISSIPTVIVQMLVQSNANQVGIVNNIIPIEFELSRQALGTMLNGLEKISEQLSGMQ